jgi:hypothetical protein
MSSKDKSVTCKKCGRIGLKWAQGKSGRWYLETLPLPYAQAAPHRCQNPERTAHNNDGYRRNYNQ